MNRFTAPTFTERMLSTGAIAPVDVCERDNEFVVRMACAGCRPDDIEVTVEMEPSRGDDSIVVVNRLRPDILPPLFIAAAERGLRGALQSGELGFPVMNVKATLVDATQKLDFPSYLRGEASMKHRWDRHNDYEQVLVQRCYETLEPKYKERFAGTDTYLKDNCWAMLESLAVQFPP